MGIPPFHVLCILKATGVQFEFTESKTLKNPSKFGSVLELRILGSSISNIKVLKEPLPN